MAFRLSPLIRRTRAFGDLTLATTGLPMAFAAEVAALAAGGPDEHQKWLSTRFIDAMPSCIFIVPPGETPKTAAGLQGVDGSDLDMESISDLFLFVCGMEGSARPLAPSAVQPSAASEVSQP